MGGWGWEVVGRVVVGGEVGGWGGGWGLGQGVGGCRGVVGVSWVLKLVFCLEDVGCKSAKVRRKVGVGGE